MERDRLMNNNINFVKMQMEERDLIKRNLKDRDMIEEKYLSDKAVIDFDEKERLKKLHFDQLKKENLHKLHYQMEDRKKRMINDDKLNINEANLNNYIGVI